VKLTIEREKWLRGTGEGSLLDSEQKKMCCVGFFALALGYSKKEIQGHAVLSDLEQERLKGMRWCFDKNDLKEGSDLNKLYSTNDSLRTSDTQKEKTIKRLFKRHKVEVEFV